MCHTEAQTMSENPKEGPILGMEIEEKDRLPVDHEELVFSDVSADSALFDEVVGHIQDVLVETRFQQLLQGFLEKHWQEFDYEEENKLHYTAIFQEYISVIESFMEHELGKRIPGFKMDCFLSEMRSHQQELEGEVFEVLSSFADFVTFKQLILDYKAVREGRVADLSVGVPASAV